jgi:competence protein ComEA
MVRKCIGVDAAIGQPVAADTSFHDHTALAISLERRIISASSLGAVKRLALGLPIDLNLATEEDLCLVPGVGNSLAARIVEYRLAKGKIESLSELVTIPGIKDKKLLNLRRYLHVNSGR